MYLAPTFGEVAFWLICLLVTIVVLLKSLVSTNSNGQVEDLAAWQRNYDRMQRR